jgi:hypothetical protein
MPTNCLTFDASTGHCSVGCRLTNDKHPKLLIVGRNQEQDHIKTCTSTPPTKIVDGVLFRASLKRNRLIEIADPKEVVFYVKNSRRIKPSPGIQVLGHHRACFCLPQGGHVEIQNGRRKWIANLPVGSLDVVIKPI